MITYVDVEVVFGDDAVPDRRMVVTVPVARDVWDDPDLAIAR